MARDLRVREMRDWRFDDLGTEEWDGDGKEG